MFRLPEKPRFCPLMDADSCLSPDGTDAWARLKDQGTALLRAGEPAAAADRYLEAERVALSLTAQVQQLVTGALHPPGRHIYGVQGAHLNTLGLSLCSICTPTPGVYAIHGMEYTVERLPTLLNPLAERTCFSQAPAQRLAAAPAGRRAAARRRDPRPG
jgi:hypothetical protein